MPPQFSPDDSELSLQTLMAWNKRIADAVAAIGGDDFVKKLVGAIETIVPVHYAFLFLYRPKSRPAHLFSTVRTVRARQAVQRYVEVTYVLNPVYNAYLAGMETGVYRITELSPNAHFPSEVHRGLSAVILDEEELGYRTPGWPKGQEELIVAIRLAQGEMLELSLARPRSDGFTDMCESRLRALLPILQRLLAMHLARVRTADADFDKVPLLASLLRDFGEGALSARERQVAQLVLKGQSGEAIALSLGISLATVKTHRKKLYAKLGIANQQERFSLFLSSIPQLGN